MDGNAMREEIHARFARLSRHPPPGPGRRAHPSARIASGMGREPNGIACALSTPRSTPQSTSPLAGRWGKISQHKHSRFCLVVLRPSFSLSPRATMLPALHEEGARACRAEQRTGHPAFSIRAGTPPDLSSAGSWDGIALAHRVRRGGVDNAMPLANMTIARDHTSYH